CQERRVKTANQISIQSNPLFLCDRNEFVQVRCIVVRLHPLGHVNWAAVRDRYCRFNRTTIDLVGNLTAHGNNQADGRNQKSRQERSSSGSRFTSMEAGRRRSHSLYCPSRTVGCLEAR